MTSNFKKKIPSKRYLAGTKPSLHTGQLITSTGVPAMDTFIGGGLAVGTVLLIEEDMYNSFANVLVKYFIAEGVVCGHSLCLASSDNQPDSMIEGLPNHEDSSTAAVSNLMDEIDTEGVSSMKIAWRYENLPVVPTVTTKSTLGHNFDLAKVMPSQRLATIEKYFFKYDPIATNILEADETRQSWNLDNLVYSSLLRYIRNIIHDQGFTSSISKEMQSGKVLRIVISSLASPLWACDGRVILNEDTCLQDLSLVQFLIALRALLRSSCAVCMITLPTHIFEDTAYVRRIERLCDTVIALESVVGSRKEVNPLFKNYHGLFHIRKLPRVNSLTSHIPETGNLAFKLKRRKFIIEKMFLPPDLAETANRAQEDPMTKGKQSRRGIGSSNRSIDF